MKKYIIIILFGLITFAAIPVCKNMYAYNLRLDEAIGLSIFDAIAGNTKWAPGYSLSKFRTLEPGMASLEVIAIMGDPLAKADWYFDQPTWFYSTGADGGTMSNSSYSSHVRAVHFDNSNRVTSVTCDYYND